MSFSYFRAQHCSCRNLSWMQEFSKLAFPSQQRNRRPAPLLMPALLFADVGGEALSPVFPLDPPVALQVYVRARTLSIPYLPLERRSALQKKRIRRSHVVDFVSVLQRRPTRAETYTNLSRLDFFWYSSSRETLLQQGIRPRSRYAPCRNSSESDRVENIERQYLTSH